MRQIIFVAMLVSALVGVFHPAWVNETSVDVIASRPVFDVANGFRAVEANLDAARGPVRLLLQAEVKLPISKDTEFSLYALRNNTVVFVSSATLSNSKRLWSAGQAETLSASAGIFAVRQSGTYTFRVAAKDGATQGLDRLKLIVKPVSSLETLEELALFDRSGGYMSAEIPLDAQDSPLQVIVEADAPFARLGETEIAIHAVNENKAAFASIAKFSTSADVSLANKSARMIAHPGTINIEKSGTYRFYAAPGGKDGIGFSHLELVLKPDTVPADRRISNIAFAVAALLLVLFHFSQYLPGGGKTAASEFPPQGRPKKPKWGRDAADQ